MDCHHPEGLKLKYACINLHAQMRHTKKEKKKNGGETLTHATTANEKGCALGNYQP